MSAGQRRARAAVTAESTDRQSRGAPAGRFNSVRQAMRAAEAQGFYATSIATNDVNATARRDMDGASFDLVFACNSDPSEPETRSLLVWT